MGLLSRWFGRKGTAGARDADPHRAREIVARIVALNPPLALARDHEARLLTAAQQAAGYLGHLVAEMPPAREASAAAWTTDPYIHAFFGAPADVCVPFSRSAELLAYFDEHLGADHAFAVLGMAVDERQTFGVAQHGDSTRTDVAQTTISFSDHQVRLCGESEAALRREIVLRIIDQLVLEGLQKIAADTQRYDSLERERALLKTRLQILERQGAGVRSLTGGDGGFNSAEKFGEAARLRAQIDENDKELAQLPMKTEALDRHLQIICDVLASSSAHFYVLKNTYLLDALNVVVPRGDPRPAREIELRIARLPARQDALRAFSLVRFERANLLPQRDLHERARDVPI
ncbi:hypothetical protein LJ656_08430 [Paraburkholderia sp. MMS20-SJTR3]|uniref:Uncharacterized protein n=1 Tax=Paraburkholderia sejongensis TaxID=2886946 RepID=A0ABS8JRW1_9BURK|nr:hypothetical protein [Paraburkholderia sp. MMS20-SJTR3]MCC8392612.1 hypothetical protein [Paraburkholderia sp. MMS20-SJTR3]